MNVPALAHSAAGKMTMTQAVALLEKRMIGEAMRQTNCNQLKAAMVLGVTRRVLRYKIEVYGMEQFMGPEPEPGLTGYPVRQQGGRTQVAVSVSVAVESE